MHRCRFSVLLIVFFLALLPLAQAQNDKYLHDTLPAQWVQQELFEQKLPTKDRWWKQFNDPVLEQLMAWAVEKNYDVLQAIDKMDAARASWRMQQSGFYPQIEAAAGWTPQSASIGLNPMIAALGSDRTSQPGTAQLNLAWEVDIIGRVRKSAAAQKHLYRASRSEYNAVMVALCAQVATVYMDCRMAQKQLAVAKANLVSQKNILDIVEARFKSGLVSALDVAQAASLYENTRANIPMLEAALLSYSNTLGMLIGDYPWKLRTMLEASAGDFPAHPDKVAVGIPADIIRQRPDVNAVESGVLSAAAQVGATKADWWPKFYVNASIGYGSNNFEGFGKDDNLFWQIGPLVRWTLFSGGQQMQATKAARASLDAQINEYNKTILTALMEVDNAMNLYGKSIEQVAAMNRAVKQAQKTLDLSLDLYTQGLADFQNVQDAQRYLYYYQSSNVSYEGQSLQYLIQLYKSLGGGWTASTN